MKKLLMAAAIVCAAVAAQAGEESPETRVECAWDAPPSAGGGSLTASRRFQAILGAP